MKKLLLIAAVLCAAILPASAEGLFKKGVPVSQKFISCTDEASAHKIIDARMNGINAGGVAFKELEKAGFCTYTQAVLTIESAVYCHNFDEQQPWTGWLVKSDGGRYFLIIGGIEGEVCK